MEEQSLKDISWFVAPKSIRGFNLVETRKLYNDELRHVYKNDSFDFEINIIQYANEEYPLEVFIFNPQEDEYLNISTSVDIPELKYLIDAFNELLSRANEVILNRTHNTYTF